MTLRENLYRLNDDDLEWVLLRARWRKLQQDLNFLRPVYFGLKTALGSFALLFVLPMQPLSMFVAFGGGLSFALIWRAK